MDFIKDPTEPKKETYEKKKSDDSDDGDGPLASHNQDADDSMDIDDMPSDSNEVNDEASRVVAFISTSVSIKNSDT